MLSEFAGAADELHDALLVNPHDIEGLRSAIRLGVEMPEAEAGERMASMAEVVASHDIHWWAQSFLDDLQPMSSGREDALLESQEKLTTGGRDQETHHVHAAQ